MRPSHNGSRRHGCVPRRRYGCVPRLRKRYGFVPRFGVGRGLRRHGCVPRREDGGTGASLAPPSGTGSSLALALPGAALEGRYPSTGLGSDVKKLGVFTFWGSLSVRPFGLPFRFVAYTWPPPFVGGDTNGKGVLPGPGVQVLPYTFRPCQLTAVLRARGGCRRPSRTTDHDLRGHVHLRPLPPCPLSATTRPSASVGAAVRFQDSPRRPSETKH